jgi:competence protein CoiA
MKFALVNGERRESEPGTAGACPLCDRPMVPKCGTLRVWHWAHKGKLQCDSWWEPETEWHRAWKGIFPSEWQEVVHFAADGEKHIADVKSADGWVLEFQHSPLAVEERQARTDFYKRMLWVVDGTRRKRDIAQFNRALHAGVPMNPRAPIMKLTPNGCRLLEEWAGTAAPVFLDFGEQQRVWWMFARGRTGVVYVAPYAKAELIASHRGSAPDATRQFSSFVDDLPGLIANYEHHESAPQPGWMPPPTGRFRRPFRF